MGMGMGIQDPYPHPHGTHTHNPTCVTVYTTNVPRTQALPVDALQKHMRNLKAISLGPEKKASSGGQANITYMVIILHNQDSLQSVLADITSTLIAPASILQFTIDNPDRVGQHSLVQSHVAYHIHFLGILLYV
jgi:hypothetical protein